MVAKALPSNGQPAQRVKLARYTAVQEQPVWWARVGSQNQGAYVWGQSTAACQVTLNATDVHLAGTKPGQDYLASITGSGLVSLAHCEVWGGRLWLTPYYETQFTVQWLNTMFWRTTLNIEDAQSPWRAVNLSAYNNLFYRGYLGLQHNYYSIWQFHDNAFDGAGLTAGGSAWGYGPGNSHNGYINTPVLPASTGGDVPLTTFAYESGPGGSFYQQSTAFRDLGSRSAADAGLTGFATQADQSPDSGTVDLGYHYPIISAPATCPPGQFLCVNSTLPLCGTDPQNLSLTFITVQAPAHGTLGYGQAGNFVYTPNNCYSGADTFTYKVNNGYLDSPPDTVTVTMSTTVTATPDDTQETCKHTATSFDVSGWDSCGLAVTYALVGGPPPNAQSFSLSPEGLVQYTPANGYCGSDSFQFRAVNQCGQVSAPATVSIKVGDPNPVANCQEVMTGKNTPITIALSGETDETCGEALTFEILVPGSGPLNGTLGPIVSVDSTHATVTYTPDTDFEGLDAFDFTVKECGFVAPFSRVPINVVSAPILVTSCRQDRLLLHWSPPQLPDGFIRDFLIYRCDTTGGDCEPTSVYQTVSDPNARFFEDTAVQADKTYCYRVSFRHQTGCDPPAVYESPLSNKDCNHVCAPTSVLITGNNAADGFGPIKTFDYLTGNLLNSFVPDGANNSQANGRGVAVRGTELFYTEVGPTGSDGIHIAPYGMQGSGGSDLRTPLSNPRPGAGIQDLVFYNGALYILTGYPSQTPQVFKLEATTGIVIEGPIPITNPARKNSDGFTVLPNGNFLINDGDGEPVYHEYDKVTGEFVSNGLEIDLRTYGFLDGTGVQLAPDGQSLYFMTDVFRSNQTVVQTDLTGGLMGFQPIGFATIEDIEIVTY